MKPNTVKNFSVQAVKVAKRWVKNEDGFQVFEKFGLTQGGVLLAIGVAAVSVLVMNDYWSGVGNKYFGNTGGIGALQPGNTDAIAPGWGAKADTGWN
ncbi:hypothetical protein ACFYU8_18380 [Brevibacillus sp. NPDC003359]|uniref:hypothetical protein n=1 Tax=unclassified Brevibacillus TaxID=2684853 RepID=UPI0036A17F99